MSHDISQQFDAADQALRENLHRNELAPTARDHMERALTHVAEVDIAIQEPGTGRSVQQIASQPVKSKQRRQGASPRAAHTQHH